MNALEKYTKTTKETIILIFDEVILRFINLIIESAAGSQHIFYDSYSW